MPLENIDVQNPVNRAHPLNRGRVSWWLTLPQWYGGNRFYDLMSLSPGTLTNMGSGSGWRSTTRPGGAGHLLFDNTDDSVTVASAARFDLPSFSFSLWWNGASKKAYAGPLQNRISGQRGWQFVDEQGSTSFFQPHLTIVAASTAETAQFKAATTLAVPFGRWRHFIWTYNGTTARLYIDGVDDNATTSASANYLLNGISIGRSYDYVGGAIDDVGVWNRSLSAVEARALYDASRLGYPDALNRYDEPMLSQQVLGLLLARRRAALRGTL